MKYKILIVFICLFFLSGCSIKYDLYIEKKVSENISFSEKASFFEGSNDVGYEHDPDSYSKSLTRDYVDNYINMGAESDAFYGRTKITDDFSSSPFLFNYSVNDVDYNFFKNKINSSYFFYNYVFDVENNRINIKVSDFNVDDNSELNRVNNIDINIISNYSSIESNATNITTLNDNYVYSWRYSSFSDIDISLVLDLNNTLTKKNSFNSFVNALILIIFVLLICGLSFFFLRKKNIKNNKI